MKSSLVSFATDDSVPALKEHELPMAHLAYGAIAFCVFLALLAVLWSFRNTAGKPRSQAGRKIDH
ncbi:MULTISPECIES: hypothetical protein [Allobranchiibius]|uniref:Uncharacterized protein n=1 Tax=Allobranchiibius huperziae TaxID=1874116 RepID=A0A853DGN3_9MICO|nr:MULTISPECIES: hypothetical protein [Allobranchiibius]MBO1765245.1 hypothetical protein [Allobranchiibius sp. GilTou38]NYJ74204.1 hypothetical protein [Allobranchiibius huperziae]UIJ34395.1 hypothetical protein LVQ62_14960 [Allobranchiibius sp. GilTou73]